MFARLWRRTPAFTRMSSTSSSAMPDELTSFLRPFYPTAFFSPRSVRLPSPAATEDSPEPRRARPFVTLTYAQSADGKIAGLGGKQVRLSGDESMLLTHKLREMHDSILVGIGTVLTDDPQLNARLPTLVPKEDQPQPIVLDSYLRTPPPCRLIKNYLNELQPIPIVVGSAKLLSDMPYLDAELDEAGATVVPCAVDGEGKISLPAVLDTVVVGNSVMVEGGASIITSFLSQGLADIVVITESPVVVGEGIPVVQAGVNGPKLEELAAKAFGKDTVRVLRPVKP